jgi:hypothetical protein
MVEHVYVVLVPLRVGVHYWPWSASPPSLYRVVISSKRVDHRVGARRSPGHKIKIRRCKISLEENKKTKLSGKKGKD